MKKLLLASTAVGALAMAGPALAADIPVKAPPAVAPVFTWTGCYIGGHGGFGAAQKYYELTSVEINTAFLPFGPPHPAGFTSFSHDPYGGFGGGQIGCQYQWDKWVIGIDGSGSWAHIQGDSGGINLPFQPNSTPTPDKAVSFNSRTDWFASVTGKFGYTGGRWLVYSKAGVAWDHTKFFADGFYGEPTRPLHLTDSDNRTGWTTGVGLEIAALPWLTIFLEYDHYDFGKRRLHFSGTYDGFGTIHNVLPLDNKQRIDTIRLGFNWLFNWGKAPTPVVAKY
jgi:outer membrane immunogenic protein